MKCSFCGEKIPLGRGKMFVKNDGRIFTFCNSKCERNWKMGREGKYVKWTKISRKRRKPEK